MEWSSLPLASPLTCRNVFSGFARLLFPCPPPPTPEVKPFFPSFDCLEDRFPLLCPFPSYFLVFPPEPLKPCGSILALSMNPFAPPPFAAGPVLIFFGQAHSFSVHCPLGPPCTHSCSGFSPNLDGLSFALFFFFYRPLWTSSLSTSLQSFFFAVK